MTVEAAEEGVSKQLVARFGDTIGVRVILREIATAESELRGQVPAAAMSEFVHRLAAIRLAERIGRAGHHGGEQGVLEAWWTEGIVQRHGAFDAAASVLSCARSSWDAADVSGRGVLAAVERAGRWSSYDGDRSAWSNGLCHRFHGERDQAPRLIT
jgi:hypothetical protein